MSNPSSSSSANQSPSAFDDKGIRLAWAGWQLILPKEWQPHKIEGTFSKGRMFIGDQASPYLMLRWWRPRMEGEKGFRFKAWLEHRFKKLHAAPQPGAPTPPGFNTTAWVKDFEKKEDLSRTLWYGYSPEADVVIEILMTSLTPKDIREQIIREVMPTLRAVPTTDPIPWSFFTVSFMSPPGFILQDRHLFSGDVALRFTKGKDVLILRTVYPATLALARRELPKWLEEPTFLERRRKGTFTSQSWVSPHGTLTGILRQGFKRLPIPLGRVNPLYSTAIAAVDPTRDRLLLADHQAPAEHEASLTVQVIENMNREKCR